MLEKVFDSGVTGFNYDDSHDGWTFDGSARRAARRDCDAYARAARKTGKTVRHGIAFATRTIGRFTTKPLRVSVPFWWVTVSE